MVIFSYKYSHKTGKTPSLPSQETPFHKIINRNLLSEYKNQDVKVPCFAGERVLLIKSCNEIRENLLKEGKDFLISPASRARREKYIAAIRNHAKAHLFKHSISLGEVFSVLFVPVFTQRSATSESCFEFITGKTMLVSKA